MKLIDAIGKIAQEMFPYWYNDSVDKDKNIIDWYVTIEFNPMPDECRLCNATLKEILESESPYEKFEKMISNGYCPDIDDYIADYHIVDQIMEKLTNYMAPDEASKVTYKEICDIVTDRFAVDFDRSLWNIPYNITVMLDTGDANEDFTANNALNYASDYRKTLSYPSAILWLAKQYGMERELLEGLDIKYDKYMSVEMKSSEKIDDQKRKDMFIRTVIEELENNSACCSGLTFLVRLPLFKYFELLKAMKDDSKKDYTLKVPRKAMCGLFDDAVGGGSILGIDLPSDLTVPIKLIHYARIDGTERMGYGVGDVFGLAGSAWSADAELNKTK